MAVEKRVVMIGLLPSMVTNGYSDRIRYQRRERKTARLPALVTSRERSSKKFDWRDMVTNVYCVARPIPAGRRGRRLRDEGRTKRWHSERRGSRRTTATTTATFETC